MKTCIELFNWILPAWQSLLFAVLGLLFYLRGEGYHRFMLSLFMLGNLMYWVIRGVQYHSLLSSPLSEILFVWVWLCQLPLFYLFLKSLLQPGYVLKIREWKHFIGPLAAALALLTAWKLSSGDLSFQTHRFNWKDSVEYTIYLGFLIQFITYTYYSWKRYPHHMRLIFNYYSDPEHYELHWLRWLLFSFVGLFFMTDILRLVDFEFFSVHQLGFPLLILFLNMGVGFLGLSQPVFFYEYKSCEVNIVNDFLPKPDDKKQQPETMNNASYSVTDELERHKAIFLKAQYILETQKLYTNPELTLADLARAISVNTKYLSAAINALTGQTFSSWVNEYRVKAVAKMLEDENITRMSLNGIYESCGFRNKTTFLNAFKKYFGVTPSQYKSNNGGKSSRTLDLLSM
ncbi:MAG: helix-turn-helix transcriptional regulator [Bacteroidales bacterium]|nr:helix-turn-helix transcriptional regulator [Bacteroidales bacterium]